MENGEWHEIHYKEGRPTCSLAAINWQKSLEKGILGSITYFSSSEKMKQKELLPSLPFRVLELHAINVLYKEQNEA